MTLYFSVKDEYKDQLEEIGQKIMESPAVLSISYTAEYNRNGRPYAQYAW